MTDRTSGATNRPSGGSEVPTSLTPARDALIATVANIDQLTSDPNVAARLALALALDMAQGELVAALIESGWRPTDDQLRAMGGSQVVWSSTYDAWRFPRTEEPAEVDPRCTGTLGSRPEWMSPGQYDPCRCRLDAGHDGPHWCEHLDEPDPRTEEATDAE